MIIVNRCPADKMPPTILTDKHIYDMVNQGISFEKIADQISSENESLHTFNPALLNYFKDEYAINNFYIFKRGQFVRFFEDETIQKKLKFLGPGEVVADTGGDISL